MIATTVDGAAEPLPVLQIVHISDAHFSLPGACKSADGIVRAAISTAGTFSAKLRRWLFDYWADGAAGHALDALIAFESFLTGKPLPTEPAGTRDYPSGAKELKVDQIPTWLVDTGDLASVGDDASISAEIKWVDAMATLLSAKETIRLYGNHDAWPERFPLVASGGDLASHRKNLRLTRFAARQPSGRISHPIGNGDPIELYCLNSVVHSRWMNTFARGRIDQEYPWEYYTGLVQLAQLRSLVAAGAKKAFRILLSHHPIHYPNPPTAVMTMIDAVGVAQALVVPGTGPLAHLVLSGHTHRLHPGLKSLPANAGFQHHPPLGQHQLQLIVGSLSKAVRFSGPPSSSGYDAAGEPHQCQVLRFFALPGVANSLLVKRAVIGRNNGTGRFKFMPVASDSDFWESVVLAY
jgi:hypothetical protein